MFNVDEKDFLLYLPKYPDALAPVAERYQEFSNTYDDVLLTFNQHLKLFPIIDSWRVDICYAWDICRMSAICAYATYEEKFKGKYEPNDISNKRISTEMIVEYYAENTILRLYHIMEKIGHPLNTLYNFNLREREVSFVAVRDLLYKRYPSKAITKSFRKLDEDINRLKIRQVRHAITHRKDPLTPKYSIKRVNINKSKVVADIPVLSNPMISTDDLMSDTNTYFHTMTTFISEILMFILDELERKFNTEQLFFGHKINRFSKKKSKWRLKR